MKTLLLTFVLSLFCACAFPQKITGKWDCSKEMLSTLNVRPWMAYGYYKFKKDGTFVLKIKDNPTPGAVRATSSPNYVEDLSIEVTGTYFIENGQINTVVLPKDIRVYCGGDDLRAIANYERHEDMSPIKEQTLRGQYLADRDKYNKLHEEEFVQQLLQNADMWFWKNEKVVRDKKILCIGDKVVLRK